MLFSLFCEGVKLACFPKGFAELGFSEALECLDTLQDAVDSLQSESEQARALREIRGRHPAFDMAPFLQSLKQDVGVVIKVCGGDLEWGGSLNGEEGYAWVPSCHPLLRK